MEELDDINLPPRIQFIKNEAPKLHPAFSFYGKYDRDSDEFIPTGVPIDRQNSQSQIELSDLQTALQEFQQSYSDGDPFSNIDLQNCTWNDVLRKLAEAKDNYTAEENRGIGCLKAIWQKTGRNTDKIEPWLDFIPDEYGLNFVRAGIVIILQFAKRSADNGERLKQAFIQVVDAVAKSIPQQNVLKGKKSLQIYTRELYVLVLKAVALIIKYLLHGVEKRLLKKNITKMFKSSSQDRETQHETAKITIDQIEKSVKNVQDQADRVNLLYKQLMDEIQVEGYDKQIEIQKELHLVNENAYESRRIGNEILQNYLPNISRQYQQITDHLDQFPNFLNFLRAREATQEQNMKILLEQLVHTEFANMLNDLLRDQDRYTQGEDQRGRLMTASPYGSPRSQTPAPRSELLVTLPEFLNILQVPPESPSHDLDVVTMEKSWLKSENITVAERLAQAPRFRDWFTTRGSGFLLVEGNDEEHAVDAMSCMSFVCLTIIGRLITAHRPRDVVISFFCGLHRDQHEGPNFMIRSLVMQVLLALKLRQCLDLGFVSNEYFVRGLQDHKPSDLLNVLAALLGQFPANTTIYCVLDGVNHYEGGYPRCFKADMMFFIRELRDLTISHLEMHHYGLMRNRSYSSHRCNLKLLLTSTNTPDLCWNQVVHPSNRVSTSYLS